MPHDFDNSPTADIILRSAGSKVVEFKAHRTILSMTSPVFETMFSLPQPGVQKSLPFCDLSEDANTIEALLKFIYPVEDPNLRSLEELAPVLDAAMKYEIAVALYRLRKILVQPDLVEKDPLQAYAIATRWGFEEEMKITSGYTLGLDIINSPTADTLDGVSTSNYRRLLIFHLERAQGAQRMLDDVAPRNPVCSPCRAYVERWHEEFKRKAREELSLRPTSKVVCSFEFLGPIVDGIEGEGCSLNSCKRGGRKLETFRSYLEALKKRIDMLPNTI